MRLANSGKGEAEEGWPKFVRAYDAFSHLEHYTGGDRKGSGVRQFM